MKDNQKNDVASEYSGLPLILTSDQAATIARTKNGRSFTRWARAHNVAKLGRDRWSRPAVIKAVTKWAYSHCGRE